MRPYLATMLLLSIAIILNACYFYTPTGTPESSLLPSSRLGSISGRIIDVHEKPMGNVSIEILIAKYHEKLVASSKEDGTFSFASVPAGQEVELRFKYKGYRPISRYGAVTQAKVDCHITVTLVPQANPQSLLQGQQYGRLHGRVYDPCGSIFPSAEVVLFNENSKKRYGALTDAQGLFSFSGIPPYNDYRITIEAPGFVYRQYGVPVYANDDTAFSCSLLEAQGD